MNTRSLMATIIGCAMVPLLITGVTGPAWSDEGGGGISVSPRDPNGRLTPPTVGVDVTDPSSGGGPERPSSGSSGGPQCSYEPLPQLQEDTAGLRDWLPPAGMVEAVLYRRVCDGLVRLVWLDNAPADGSPGGPSATQLASRAYGELTLPVPVAAHSPDLRVDGFSAVIVGVHTWVWVDPASWTARSKRVSARATWAEVTATPVELRFDPGDGGGPVSCPSGGTPYDPAAGLDSASPDCDYVYTGSSADRPGGVVSARYAVVWQVSWTGADRGVPASGSLPDLISRTTVPIRVVESQAVNQ